MEPRFGSLETALSGVQFPRARISTGASGISVLRDPQGSVTGSRLPGILAALLPGPGLPGGCWLGSGGSGKGSMWGQGWPGKGLLWVGNQEGLGHGQAVSGAWSFLARLAGPPGLSALSLRVGRQSRTQAPRAPSCTPSEAELPSA